MNPWFFYLSMNLKVREQICFFLVERTNNKGYLLFWNCKATLSSVDYRAATKLLPFGDSPEKISEGNGQLSFCNRMIYSAEQA